MQDAIAVATLHGRSGPFSGVSIPVPPYGLNLGRESPGVDRLAFGADSDVSRNHCSVRYDDARQTFTVVDHGSSNGTFLMPEGRRLAPHQEVVCRPGESIRLGHDSIFELRAAAPVAATGRATPGELPRLADGQRLDLRAIRVPYERFYFFFVCLPAVLVGIVFIGAVVLTFTSGAVAWQDWGIVAIVLASFTLSSWMVWKLFTAMLLGNSIRVGPGQYPQIHALVVQASEILGVTPPTVLILQGHGVFELYAARRFSRRGLLIITSNMLDDLSESGSSRELMFFVGRQLGLIASGYFDWWAVKHLLGQFATFFYLGWCRRCQLTADRLGLLVTGDPLAAEQAMIIITAGFGIAANTRIQALREQREELFASGWAWLHLGFASYPYMVDRILRLREFADEAMQRGIHSNAPLAIGALPLQHRPIRALPVFIVHGHDRTARLELENFLRRALPHVEPILMVDETGGAASLPEKFERLGRGAKGALVLLTPDDVAMAAADRMARHRARQNVIGEVFWLWARLGRQRLLLLSRGELEIPSDLSGVDVHRFQASPIECSEAVRDFISALEGQ